MCRVPNSSVRLGHLLILIGMELVDLRVRHDEIQLHFTILDLMLKHDSFTMVFIDRNSLSFIPK